MEDKANLKMFVIECETELKPNNLRVSFGTGCNGKTEDFMSFVGKKEEYLQYLYEVNEIFKQVSEQLSDLTHDFVKKNFADDKFQLKEEELVKKFFSKILGSHEVC